ncbi:hypothetical protein N431DRAFT_476922 [Stipitochalara longipes BDJ]|nr:hypothetical protein N431DRAFT_476922 [Stipitochalara longipes BDJ]
MVSLAAFASAISMALLASTASAAPGIVAERQPPPTSSVLDFTLYKTLQAGSENQCWWGAPGNNQGHPPPSEFVARNGASWSSCHQADFYTLRIYNQAPGYNCQVNVYSDNACNNYVGAVQYNSDFSQPCTFPGSSGLVDLLSWEVSCV